MVDTVDSKSAARKGVRVQVPPGVQKSAEYKRSFFCIQLLSSLSRWHGSPSPLGDVKGLPVAVPIAKRRIKNEAGVCRI